MVVARQQMSFLSYFGSPFPSTKGFSPYRMPGVTVHIPLLLAFSFTGLILCGPHPFLRALLIFWVAAGLYFGRDIAIYCHYAPLLTLIVWGGCLLLLVKIQTIAKFGATHIAVPSLLSLAVALALFFVAWKRTLET